MSTHLRSEVEWDFVTAVWWRVHQVTCAEPEANPINAEDRRLLERIAERFEPGALTHGQQLVVFAELLRAYATHVPVNDAVFRGRVAACLRKAFPVTAGEPPSGEFAERYDLDTGADVADGLMEMMWEETERAGRHRVLRSLAAKVWQAWRARQVVVSLQTITEDVEAAVEEDAERGVHLAGEKLIALQTFVAGRLSSGPTTPSELAAAELEMVERRAPSAERVSWPYPRMQFALKHILAGRIYGITAYPNQGKSTLLANLWDRWASRQVPTISFVGEMGMDFARRGWAAEAGIPQEVAENQLWDAVDDPDTMADLSRRWGCSRDAVEGLLRDYARNYAAVVRRFSDLSDWWELVRERVTPEQLVARARILRRRWPRRLVLLLLDHVHDLIYPGDEADKFAGAAVAKIKALCQEDGLMAAVVLFHPKKPEGPKAETAMCTPIRMLSARGQVSGPLDVHMSIYRRWVQVDRTRQPTPWGTPSAIIDSQTGLPVFLSPSEGRVLGADGLPVGKLDDEHMYVKPDKRRISGEGPTFTLNFHRETGHVSEPERMLTLPGHYRDFHERGEVPD